MLSMTDPQQPEMATAHDLTPVPSDKGGRWVWVPDATPAATARRSWLLRGRVGVAVLTIGLLALGGGATAIYYAATGKADPDPGVAFCEAIIEQHQSGVPAQESADFTAFTTDNPLSRSRSGHLRQAGATLAKVAQTPDEQSLEVLGDLMLVMGSIGAGCAEVGVPLPADMFAPTR